MPASKVETRVRFKTDRANEIASREGLTTATDIAAFYGVTQSNWSRVTSRAKGGAVKTTDPGAFFIAAVLASPAAVKYPAEVTFDNLFEVVPV